MAKPATSFYEFGPFRLEAVKRLLLRDGEVVPLPPKAFDTLLALIENSDRVVEKSELMDRIWPDSFVEEANLTQNVSILRKALGERAGEHLYIVTIPGRGYRFVAGIGQGSGQTDLILERHAITQIVAEREEEAIAQAEIEVEQKAFPQNVQQTKTGPGLNPTLLFFSALVLTGLIAAVSYFLIARKSPQPQSLLEVKSIAVLPFKSLSAEPGDEYLGLGMADTLILRLSNIKHLVVRPTSAVRKYSDENQDPIAAGREQQVEAVLDGSIHKAEGRIRVTARFINVRDGSSFWAGSFDEKYEDVFRLQDSIAERLAGALTLKLTGEEQQRLTKHYTENTEAYQAYLRGRYFWNKRTPDAIRKAIEQFQQAVDHDPNYALGYVGLADCYVLLEAYTDVPSSETLLKARVAADHALQIDDSLAEAHTSSAMIYQFMWRWAEAEEEFRRAISLNPNYPTAHQWYAGYLQIKRQFDDALREIKRAQELDPISSIINHHVAWIHLMRDDLNSVVEQCQRMFELDMDSGGIHYFLGSVHLKQQRYAEATAELQKAGTYPGERANFLGALGYCYAVMGRRGEAVRILEELEERYARREALGWCLAGVYAGLGEKDQAFRWLEKDFEQRTGTLTRLTFDYRFEDLRSDPRYANLVRRMGLEP